MSVNQWKLLAYLKEQFSKSGTNKSAIMLLLNKELTNTLKKVPSISPNSQIFQMQLRKDSTTKEEESDMKEKNNFLTNGISKLPTKLNDFKMKFSQKSVAVVDEKTKWKTNKSIVSNISIHARTKHILSSILTAQSESSKLQRLESLVEHLLQYPDGIRTAAKQGAITKLISVGDNNTSEAVAEVLREVLAILGYTDPLPKQGIRILAIDGGGIRGLMVMEMLQKLEELTGSKIHELFDYICGVSTGSVIACTIGASGKPVKDVMDLYRDLSNKIFTQNAFFGARSLIWKHGYYDTELWESILKEHVGVQQLIKTRRKKNCPKIGVISMVSKDDNISPFIFRNYELPYKIKSKYPGSYKYQLWEAARASAAAPTYFEEFKLGEYLHQDGGVLVNNPTAVAIHEAKQLWPRRPIQCVVSLGTGRMDSKIENLRKDKKAVKQTSWREKWNNILISATDTEAVHAILNDLLPPSVYFRFNPCVMEVVSMDEYEPEKLAAMQRDTLMYIRRNEEKFQEAAKALLIEKSLYQKIIDWASIKALKYSQVQNF